MALRRRVRPGRRARARVRAGGLLVTSRPSLSLTDYRALVARLRVREEGRCFVCRRPGRLDPHHVVKRSHGGADDADNLVMLGRGLLCRCHARTDWPVAKGRLVIKALGAERFSWWIDYGSGVRAVPVAEAARA